MAVNEMGWIYRPIPREVDFGIDAEIEIVEDDGAVTGKLIAVQLKSGTSYQKALNPFKFTFYGSEKHFNYWFNGSLPVILVFYNPETDVLNWVHVKQPEASGTEKGWKIDVLLAQKLGNESIPELTKIAENRLPGSNFLEKLPISMRSILDRPHQYFDFHIETSPSYIEIKLHPKPSAAGRVFQVTFELDDEKEFRKFEEHEKTGREVSLYASMTHSDLPIIDTMVGTKGILKLPTLKRGQDVMLRLQLSSQSEIGFSDHFTCENAGSEMIVYSNLHTLRAHKIKFTFTGNFAAESPPEYQGGYLEFDFPVTGGSVKDALITLKLFKGMHDVHSLLEVVDDSTDVVLASYRPPMERLPSLKDVENDLELFGKLYVIQKTFNKPFRIPKNGITVEQASVISQLHEIITKGYYTIGPCTVSMTVGLTRDIDPKEKTHNLTVRPHESEKVELLDQILELGNPIVILENPLLRFSKKPVAGATVKITSKQSQGFSKWYDRFADSFSLNAKLRDGEKYEDLWFSAPSNRESER